MAKAATAGKAKGGGLPIVPILVVTLLGVGSGAFFGMQIPTMVEPVDPVAQKAEALKKAESDPKKINLRELPPITTNLASPVNTWIRLETSALFGAEPAEHDSSVLPKLAEDIVAYLRTVPLDQIEGPSGFQHLREDLNDRVRIRSEGKVTELIIQAMVIE